MVSRAPRVGAAVPLGAEVHKLYISGVKAFLSLQTPLSIASTGMHRPNSAHGDWATRASAKTGMMILSLRSQMHARGKEMAVVISTQPAVPSLISFPKRFWNDKLVCTDSLVKSESSH